MTEKRCRAVVRERSGSLCESCGQRWALQMHHRRNRSQRGEWHPANILHLCVECHVYITEHPRAAHADGFTLRTGESTDRPVLYRGRKVVLYDNGLAVAA